MIPYSWLAVIVLAAGLALSGYLLKNEISKHAVTKQSLEQSEQAVLALQDAFEELEEDRNSITQKTSEVNSKLSAANRELANFRNREDIIVAKPTLISLRINKAFTKVQEELACETGDLVLCKD